MELLNIPSLEDFRCSFPRPVGIGGSINEVHGYVYKDEGDLTNGWISPKGVFFQCDFGGHESWANVLRSYWENFIYEESPDYDVPVSYEDVDKKFCDRWNYNGNMEYSDYLVSQGWLKWKCPSYYSDCYEVIKSNEKGISTAQWGRLSWLTVHLKRKYDIKSVEIF